MERFKKAIFKQREEIDDIMAKMFGLLKELTAIRTPKKVLIREEARHPITKHVNSISLIRVEVEKNVKDNEVVNESVLEPDTSDAAVPLKEVDKVNGAENRTGDEPVRRGLKHTDALVDQGSDVNVMPLSFYNKLTDEIPAETDIRLSLASYSYIYPLGIAEDVLVEIVAKAMIKFDKGTITLRSRENKISFHRMPEPLGRIEKGTENDIEPITLTMTVNRLILEWEERIKFHQ
ncbi:hypothetical protein Tco_0379544 [Tanacetum coccineum]